MASIPSWAQPASPPSTLADLEEAADKGDAVAQTKLGEMYASGEGVSLDAAKSFEWTKRAADQGYAQAQFDLGADYEKDLVLPRIKNWQRLSIASPPIRALIAPKFPLDCSTILARAQKQIIHRLLNGSVWLLNRATPMRRTP
jgi:TPR repeat protein